MVWECWRRSGVLLLLIAVLFGCSKKQAAPPAAPGQLGIASWYGKPFDGRQTASGEMFDMEKLTAAHRTLAFGTVVHVANLANGRLVEVRINDRGPFVSGRIIDLSHAAAQSIAMPSIANVRLDVISTPRTRAVPAFAVQVGEYAKREDAAAALERMRGQYGEGRLVFRPIDETWRVLVGRLPTPESGDALAQELQRQNGLAFVVRLDDED